MDPHTRTAVTRPEGEGQASVEEAPPAPGHPATRTGADSQEPLRDVGVTESLKAVEGGGGSRD